MARGLKGPALIVGGGIGGLALALSLARKGLPSRLVERRATWSEAGAGIQLSPNAIRVLELLGVAPLLEPLAGKSEKLIVRDAASGRPLQELPLGSWMTERHGAPYWQVHRRDLQAALVARAVEEPLISIGLGFEVVACHDNGQSVDIVGKSGERLDGGFLVGADGIFSHVRKLVADAEPPHFSGRTAARTVLDADAGASAVLDPTSTGVWLAPGAHIVHYPVRAGREIAIVAVRSEAWRETGWSAPVPDGEIEATLAETAPALAAAIGAGRSWRRWALLEMPPLRRWSRGRITVLGDAAHPTLPFLAQGGALAIEDAWTLASCVASADADETVADSLQNYESLRRGRAAKVVAAARRNDTVFHLSGVAARARNVVMRAMGGARVMARYDWVYGWRPQ